MEAQASEHQHLQHQQHCHNRLVVFIKPTFTNLINNIVIVFFINLTFANLINNIVIVFFINLTFANLINITPTANITNTTGNRWSLSTRTLIVLFPTSPSTNHWNVLKMYKRGKMFIWFFYQIVPEHSNKFPKLV